MWNSKWSLKKTSSDRAGNDNPALFTPVRADWDFHFGARPACLLYTSGTTSGKAVTERSAMQMTAVYSCVRILSEAIAGLPIHLYRYGEGGSKEKATNHPLYFLLHDEPNPEMTSFVFRETLMTHLLLWGNEMCIRDSIYPCGQSACAQRRLG